MYGQSRQCVVNKWTELNKKGAKDAISNYRPISLLNNFYKIFTTILNNHIQDYLSSNNLIHSNQKAFVKGGSTSQHARKVIDNIYKANTNGYPLWQIFFDFKRAYDSVNHQKLFDKMKSKDINPKIIKIIQEIYTDGTTKIEFAMELQTKSN